MKVKVTCCQAYCKYSKKATKSGIYEKQTNTHALIIIDWQEEDNLQFMLLFFPEGFDESVPGVYNSLRLIFVG